MNETEDLIKYILTQFKAEKIEKKIALTLVDKLSRQQKREGGKAIALVGMDCRLPGAKNVREYWKNLTDGKDSITLFPEDRRKDIDPFLPAGMAGDPERVYTRGGFLRDIDKFDAAFFRISPREAMLMDPCHRLVLQSAYRALEDGNALGEGTRRRDVGVYVGLDSTDILQYSQMVEALGLADLLSVTGSLTSLLAGRISYTLGLSGPSLVIDTACSSGLVAVVEACKALRNHDCRLALAGGCHLMLTPLKENKILEIESGGKNVRAFDKDAEGTVFSEGVCFVALKRWEDAVRDGDDIYCMIRSGVVNSDGASSGLTAPNPEAQVMLYRKAWEEAGIEPESVSYIEAHGTGTIIGDSVELESLTSAFRQYTRKNGFCGIGSVKSNIGHTKGASGIASLIKVALALKNRTIPPSIHFKAPHPRVNLETAPVYINHSLRPWESAAPLRGGISSFGFSGTNAHLVVEECAGSPAKADAGGGMALFTITARSKESLGALIRAYIDFLDEARDVSLTSLCYTVNVWRPHFSCRIIILTGSVADLREKLAAVESDPPGACTEDIYYAEIPEQSRRNRKDAAPPVPERMAEAANLGDQERIELLRTLCGLYTRGERIPWEKLYPGKTAKVRLPGYVFDKKRVWIDTSGYKKEVRKDRIYHLVDELLIDTETRAVYKTRLSVADHWPVAEHKIFNQHVLPATAFMDMVAFVCRDQTASESFSFKDTVFLQTVTLDENESVDIFMIVNKLPDKMELQVISQREAESPASTLHMKTVLVSPAPAPREITGYAREKAGLRESSASYQIDNTGSGGDLVLGPRWWVKGTVYEGEAELLADIEIPASCGSEFPEYNLYPSLMDVAINYAAGALGDDIYVPFSIGEFHVRGKMTPRMTSYVTRVKKEGHSDEIIYVDVVLYNDRHEVFAFLHHYAMKKLRPGDLDSRDRDFFRRFFYRTRWVRGDDADTMPRDLRGEKFLFIRKRNAFSDSLLAGFRETGASLGEVVWGNDPPGFRGSAAEYRSLATLVKDRGIRTIVHMLTLEIDEKEGKGADIKRLDTDIQESLAGLCHLVRGLTDARVGEPVELVLLTCHAALVSGEETVINPLNSAYQGMAGVISRENSHLFCRAIDIDQHVQTESVIRQIACEQKRFRVALRGNRTYTPEITNKFPDPFSGDHAMSLKDNGRYLITGGMGGIGREIARTLCGLAGVSVLITGRASLDDPAQTEKREFFKKLRREGAEVEYFRADVADYKRMDEVFRLIKDKYGKLDGIFHCAGIPGDKFLYNTSMHKFLETLTPKIAGTCILDHLTRDWNLDFMLLFSSIATILVPPGQMDYVAANSYLNGYAEMASRRGRNIKTVLWPAWRGGGMAFQANKDSDEGLDFGFLKSISKSDALRAMRMVLDSNIRESIVCELDFSAAYHNDLDQYGFSLDKELEERFSGGEAAAGGEESRDVSLLGKDAFTATEQLVGNVWGKILGLNVLNITEDFYQLGGDSIHSIQIVNEINSLLQLNLDVVDIFDYPSIAELSAFLDSRGRSPQPVGESQALAGKVREHNLCEVQLRIWFMQKLFPAITIYNLPMVIKIDFAVSPEAIGRALNIMIKRHSVLRTVFLEAENEVRQRILDEYTLKPEVTDFFRFKEDVRECENEIYAACNKPFDLTQPLISAGIYRVRENLHYLCINMHHLICDGWSSRLFSEELMQTYLELSGGKEADSAEVTPLYIDWIAGMDSWKRGAEYVKQKEYWQTELAGPLPLPDLPTDYTRPEKFTYKGQTHAFHLSREVFQSLKGLSVSLSYTVNVIIQTLFFLFLHRICGDEDIILGIPVSGRDKAEFEKVIGVFINTLCIRIRWDGLKTLANLFDEVRQKNHGALRNGRMPFADLVGVLNPQRDMSRNPIYSVSFQYYDNIPPVNAGTTQFDLSLYCKDDEEEGLYCRFEYSTDLFKRETILKFEGIFKSIACVVTGLRDTGTGAGIPLVELYALFEREFPDPGLQIRNREKYWQRQLSGLGPAVNLPCDHNPRGPRDYNWETTSLEVSEDVYLQLREICLKEDFPLSLFVLAVCGVVLSKYGRREEIMVGTLIPEVSPQILPLKVPSGKEASFTGILEEIKTLISEARLYAGHPVKKMSEWAGKSQGRHSLFDVMFVYQQGAEDGLPALPAEKGRPLAGDPEILLACEHGENKLRVALSYCRELFDDLTIQRLGGHILGGLREFAAHPQRKVWTASFITDEEKNWIARVFNNTRAHYKKDETLTSLFRERVAAHPGKTALVAGDKKMTYSELNVRANKVAGFLLQNGGGAHKVIGVLIEASLEMVTAILGILKSGGTYLPLDVHTPRERIKYILAHAEVDILLVSGQTAGSYGELCREVRIDSPAIAAGSGEDLSREVTPGSLAYIIYTSGSTGKPKGVMVSHRNANNFLNWGIRHFSLDETHRLMLVTSISFDISVLEIFGSLLAGAELHIIGRDLLYNPPALGQYCREMGITIWHSVPSLMVQYLAALDEGNRESFRIESLRHVMLGGEAWSAELARKVRDLFPDARITNMYGPTEATIWVTSHTVSEQEAEDSAALPIGKPIFNNKVLILDEEGNLCGAGIPGGIYIQGDNVTPGYYKNEEKTKENFLRHPEYGELYRTGDIGIYAAKGMILFLGRIDNQVKVRGYRIELGEIENVLSESSEIRQTAVVVRKEGESNRLVCYYTSEEPLKLESLREYLARKLPEYMIPAQFVHLRVMPLTPNGKINRLALPDVGIRNTDADYAAPQTPLESRLAETWQEALQVERVGTKDNFFQLGGDSIKSIQIVNRINKAFGVNLDIVHVFDYPTVAELAGYISAAGNKSVKKRRMATEPDEKKEHDLSQIQLGIWITQKLFPRVTIYNLYSVIWLDSRVDLTLLEKAVRIMVRRHSVFRTVFVERGYAVKQIVLDEYDAQLDVLDWTDKGDDFRALEQQIHKENNTPFDFKEPLFRIKVYRLHNGLNCLFTCLHHLISDGWSYQMFIDELLAIEKTLRAEEAVNEEEKLPRYTEWVADCGAWKKGEEFERQKEYWTGELCGQLPVTDLPLDYARPDTFTHRGSNLLFYLDNELAAGIRKISMAMNHTRQVLLQALFFLFLNRMTRDEDIILGIPVAGRHDPLYEGVIGVFINTLAIRIRWDGLASLSDFLEEVKRKNYNAFRNSKIPFFDVLKEINPEKDISRNAIFTIFFQYYDNIPYANEGSVQFDLSLYCKDDEKGISCRFEYNSDLLKEETIRKFSHYFIQFTQTIIALFKPDSRDFDNLMVLRTPLRDINALLDGLVDDETLLLHRQKKYWQKKFASGLPQAGLPLDYPWGRTGKPREQVKVFGLDQDSSVKIRRFCQEENISFAFFMLTAYIITLSRYHAQEEILVSTLGFEERAGILPLLYDRKKDQSFRENALVLKKAMSEIRENKDYPFCEMMKLAGVDESGKENPFFEVMFVRENPGGEKNVNPEGGCERFPFVLFCEEDSFQGFSLRYNAALFHENTVERIGNHLKTVVLRGIQQPDQPGEILNSVDDNEKDWIFSTFNNTYREYDKSKTLIDHFLSRVEESPAKTALVYEGQTLTYNELNRKANTISHLLMQRGAGAKSVVGVKISRGLEMVTAILGILKCGATYLPVDVDAPAERIEYILKHAGCRFLLVKGKSGSSEHSVFQEIDLEATQPEGGNQENPLCSIQPEDPAYIIYTSGSTGRPKGVMVSHGNVNNFLFWGVRNFSLTGEDRMMLVTSISFDISVFEIFGALLAGAELHIMNRDKLYDPPRLCEYGKTHGITVWHSVPSLMIQYLAWKGRKSGEGLGITSLRHIMLGGEAWSVEVARKIRKVFPGAQITNMYGPTEATIWITSHIVGDQELSGSSVLPVGKPIWNNEVYILSDSLELCGTGVPGNIYVKGDNVTLGYYRDQVRTVEVFITHPEYGPLYKTGDLGKYSGDGTIHFLGRKDNQVKVRGYRIELGEIETVLSEYRDIKQTAVIFRKAEESARLVCYYESEQEIKIETLRDLLGQKLPEYMIPAQFIHLREMPLTPNGKINRKALPEVDITADLDVPYVPPRDALEKILVEIWQEILSLERVGIRDNFFHLGGDSINAIRIATLAQQKGIEIPPVMIFEFPVPENLATALKQRAAPEPEHKDYDFVFDENNPVIRKLREDENVESFYPLSGIQLNVLNHNILYRKMGLSLSVSSTTITGKIDFELFKKAWGEVIRRHDILKTAFFWRGGLEHPVQVVYRNVENPVLFKDFSGLPQSRFSRQWEEFMEEERSRLFDIKKPPLMRITLVKTGEETFELVWTYQNSLFDGWSRNVIIEELGRLYYTDCNVNLGETFSFIDYIKWIYKQDEKEYEKFWRHELEGLPAGNGKPARTPEQGIPEMKGRSIPCQFEELGKKSGMDGITLNTLVTAAWALVIGDELDSRDFMIGINSSGRPYRLSNIGKAVGLFVNTVPVRILIDEDTSVAELLKRIQIKQMKSREYEYTTINKMAGWAHLPMEPFREMISGNTIVFQNLPLDFSLDDTRNKSDGFDTMAELNVARRVYCDPDNDYIFITYNSRVYTDNYIDGILEKMSSFINHFSLAMPVVDVISSFRKK